MTGKTTTVRIDTDTKARLDELRDDGQSIGEIMRQLAFDTPVKTALSCTRAEIMAYIRTHLIPNFGDRDEADPGERLWAQITAEMHNSDVLPRTPVAAVVDNMALGTLISGGRRMAQLLYTQPAHQPREITAPTQAIYMAQVQNPGLARHLERSRVVTPLDFDMAATLIVGELIRSNVPPQVAHVIHAAKPSIAWPTGRPVITTVPDMYQPYGVKIIPLIEA